MNPTNMCIVTGANVIPVDILHSKRTPEALRVLVQSALDINANMLRLWGGARPARFKCLLQRRPAIPMLRHMHLQQAMLDFLQLVGVGLHGLGSVCAQHADQSLMMMMMMDVDDDNDFCVQALQAVL